MIDTLRQWLTPPVFEGDEDKTRQARLLNTVLLAFLVPLLGYAVAAVILPNTLTAWAVIAIILSMEAVSLVLLRRRQVQRASLLFALGAWLFLTAIQVFFGGSTSPALFGYVLVVLIAGLLMGGRAAYQLAGLSIAGAIGVLWAQNVLPPAIGANEPTANVLVASMYLIMAAILLQTATGSLSEALRKARDYATQLHTERGRLEEAVQTRTQDLSRRTLYLEATAAIARDAAQVLDLQQLLSGVVKLISDRFDFYHCGVFLLDRAEQWAVLQAASSEGGQRMLERGHRLRVGDGAEGIVGYTCTHGEARVALDVGADAVFFDNPDLPSTRSELVLPLRARGKLIGALDVQSSRPRAFSDEDVAVLQTLAEQLAVAINNARLFQQAEESLDAERRAYAEISQQAWADLLRAQAGLGFRFDEQGVARIQGDGEELGGLYSVPRDRSGDLPSVGAPLEAGPIGAPSEAMGTPYAALRLSVVHRGQAVGSIEAHKSSGEWTAAETALMQALADQLSVALESARLFQDARRHAAHEQAVRHITEQMRRAMDMETILQTTVAEVGRALGVPRAYVRLVPRDAGPTPSGGAGPTPRGGAGPTGGSGAALAPGADPTGSLGSGASSPGRAAGDARNE